MFKYARFVQLFVVITLFMATLSVAPAVSAQFAPQTIPFACSPNDQYIHVSGGQVVFKTSQSCNQVSPHHQVTAYLWHDGGGTFALTSICDRTASCTVASGTGLRVPCVSGMWYANAYHSAQSPTVGLPWQIASAPGNSGSWMTC